MPQKNLPLSQLIKSTGHQIDYYKTHANVRRIKLMQSHQIKLVLDVGANTGQYAKDLRKAGYKGRIISFEPLADAFARLERSAARDPRWQAVHMALGHRDGMATLYQSGDPRASSLLPMKPRHEEVASYFAYRGKERAELRRLDSIWNHYVPPKTGVLLKLDTQGFEKQVLRGAEQSLRQIRGVQIELSLVPLYKGSPLLPEMLRFLNKQGFTMMSIEYGFCDPKTGQMLQVDGLFFRT